MADFHRFGAALALTLSLIALPWAAVALVVRRDPGRFFVANLAWVVLALGVTAIAGLTFVLGGKGPKDPLHLVYGALVTAAWPAAGLVASGRSPRERLVVMTVAAVVVLVLVARLFQTGG
jgi:hypothetical protein